ncbi:MAG: hypothetical protein WAX29_03570 [Propionibacterium sp.]
MSTPQNPPVADPLGPVDVVVFRLPAGGVSAGWAALREAQQQGQLLVLDVDFVQKTPGGPRTLDEQEIAALGGDELNGAHSGLLDEHDLLLAVDALGVGELAVVVLKEDLGFHRVIAAFGSEGAGLLAEEPVFAEDLQTSLDERTSQS